jgi:hypothetical protein
MQREGPDKLEDAAESARDKLEDAAEAARKALVLTGTLSDTLDSLSARLARLTVYGYRSRVLITVLTALSLALSVAAIVLAVM